MTWSAVITTYNSGSVITRSLESIYGLPEPELPDNVIVVDNASSDDTVQRLGPWLDRITLIRNETNLGLSRANNRGADLVSDGAIFFLNPDVELLPGAVTALLLFQDEHPRAAILGPSMMDADGTAQSTARTWPSPAVIASRRTPAGRSRIGGKISFEHMNRFHRTGEPVMPHWLVGAALWLTPRGRRNVGLMSEGYFLYFEDVEWCWRAWNKRMEVWYVPESKIRHVCRRESASGGRTLRLHLQSMTRFLFTHPSVLFGKGPGGTIS